MERIQPFGFLLAVFADGVIARASENLAIFLEISGVDAIGRRLHDLIEAPALELIFEREATLSTKTPSSRLYGIKLRRDRKMLDIAIHRSGGYLVIEGEWSGSERSLDAANNFRDHLAQLVKAPTLEAFHLDAARIVRQLTGFDRVLIYRLEESGSGHVISEDMAGDVDSFLGLRYPASDIPAQARELYLRNAFRVISNVNAPFIRLLPEDPNAFEPLDLSLSTTRAVSPIHLEYLRNMRVGASLSVSIIVGGRLWGLVVCHHHQPKLPGFTTRTAVELFGQLYALALAPRLASRLEEEDREVRLEAFQVMEALTEGLASISNVGWVASVIDPFIQFDGIALMVDGRLTSRGVTPDIQVIRKILRWLSSALIVKPFATDNFEWQGMAKTSVGCRGLLAIPLSNTARDFILLFRREQVSSVMWGGDPNKASWNEAGRPYLSPRKSFAPFTETVTDQAKAHTQRELRAAEILKDAFSVVRFGSASTSKRLMARPSDDAGDELVADLKRRIPAIFALIRGLAGGTAPDRAQIATYCQPLGERFAALASAYDKFGEPGRSSASLHGLFRAQLGDVLPEGKLHIGGADHDLLPDAVLPMALVIYELVSTALSTGALAFEGQVIIGLKRIDGGLMLSWREQGLPIRRGDAPAIRAASLRLVKRIISNDLNGLSDVVFLPDGLEAKLWLPERHLAD